MKLAPIILFCYNRPSHTLETLLALKSNDLADSSILYIYSDGPKVDISEHELEQLLLVRDIIKSQKWCKEVIIFENEKNMGLAQSIILGVTEVIGKHGQAIVLEDDMITSPVFLTFMNKALSFYEANKKVWHISGWNYPINIHSKDDIFLWRTMNCWGWATWSDRWKYFEKNPYMLEKTFTAKDKKKFNLDGAHNFWAQVEGNISGRIDTWAIFWYATIFRFNGLCLNPKVSYVKNIGHDGSGVHCGRNESYQNQLICKTREFRLSSNFHESYRFKKKVQEFYAGKHWKLRKNFRELKKMLKKIKVWVYILFIYP